MEDKDIQTPSVEETPKQEETAKKSFNELLNDKDYQAEFDKKISKALETSKNKWEEEYQRKLEIEKTEAEKLAKMDSEQKLKYEKEQSDLKAQEYQSKLNAYELKEQALKIAREKSIDVSLLDLIDFSKETADGVNSKLENIKTMFDKTLEAKINERLKQNTPINPKTSEKDENPYAKGFKQI